MTSESTQAFAGGCVPHLDLAVIGTGNDEAALLQMVENDALKLTQ